MTDFSGKSDAPISSTSNPFAPLQRQTSLTDPAGLIAGFPELERGLSRSSVKSAKSAKSRKPPHDNNGIAGEGRRNSDIPEAEERSSQDAQDEKRLDGIQGSYDEEKGEGEAPSGDDEVISFPDGGTTAWLVVLGGFLASFTGFGLTSALGAFQTLYRTSFLLGYSESQIAWIASTQSFMTFALSCFTGSLFDKYGPRPLIATGTFSLTLGFCMLSLCSQYYQLFLVHATLLPLGCNLMFISPIAVVGQWFNKKRGLAFGLMSTGSSAGSVTWPILLANLPQSIGFGWTCRLIALMCAICGIFAFLLLKTRLPPKPAGSFFYFQAFKDIEYTCVVLNFVAFGFGFFAFLTFIGTYGQLAGLGTLAPYLLVIQNGSSVIGRLGSGVLADKIGTYNTNILGNSLFVLVYFIWLACKTTGSCIVLAVLMGIAGGSFVCLQPPLVVMTAKDMRFAGTMIGQALFLMAFAQLACGPGFGAILGTGSPQERFNEFWKGILLCAFLSLLGALAIVVAKFHRNRRILAKT